MRSKTEILGKVTICNTQIEHGGAINQIVRAAFYIPDNEDFCIEDEAIYSMCSRFPEGQFVAIVNDGEHEFIAGTAITMRTRKPPTQPALPWWDMIGTYHLHNHHHDGDWLYGVEMAVHPDYHGYGIGTALYNARFDLVKRLKMRGWYAGGVLMGYRHYKDQMTPHEYGKKVIAGEIKDPTVTMQVNRGFQAWSVIEEYLEEPVAGNTAVLIVWNNPEYQSVM
jgi:GNAT superfamily N-acetyltransferase